MLATAPAPFLLEPAPTPARFRARLLAAFPGLRLLWMPQQGDAATAVTFETNPGKTITYDATVVARLSRLGRFGGVAQTFSAAGTQYGTSPDLAALTFGNGAADSSFSGFGLVSVNDTAAQRVIVSRWNGSAEAEWAFDIQANDTLRLVLGDVSATAFPIRASNAAISQGSWRVFGFTYNTAVGSGATAADGITLYENGVALAATSTNNAAYVAMEDRNAPLEIGSLTAHTAGFFDGSMAVVGVALGAWTAATHLLLTDLCRRFYGVPL